MCGILSFFEQNGDTPLHTAARNDKKMAIKTLVECGANMYTVNKVSGKNIAYKTFFKL